MQKKKSSPTSDVYLKDNGNQGNEEVRDIEKRQREKQKLQRRSKSSRGCKSSRGKLVAVTLYHYFIFLM